MKRYLLLAANALVVFLAILALWQLLVVESKVPAYMLPPPLEVAKTVKERWPDLGKAVLITGEAAASGLMASILAGLVIALIFARSNWIRRMFLPYTTLLQTVPIVAITPLILMWMGPGLASVSLVAFIICLAPVIANATQGLVSVDEDLVRLFKMHNATPMQVLFKLRLPHSLPHLFVGIRIASGIAVIGAITGELFAGGSVGGGGVGYSILYAQGQMQTGYLFALVFAATTMGFAFFFTVMFFEWLMLHKWHDSNVRRDDAAV